MPYFPQLYVTRSRRYSHILFVSFYIGWVRIDGADSAIINARLTPDDSGTRCVGTVSAKSGCWSFLKGGFVLDSSSQSSVLFFQVISLVLIVSILYFFFTRLLFVFDHSICDSRLDDNFLKLMKFYF